MHLNEKIEKYVAALPPSMQSEVLTFVEYLMAKAESEAYQNELRDWADLSLATAMQGIEDETDPEYSLSDVKEKFS